MTKDKLTECKRCGSDACYKQPLNLKDALYFCFGCGFTCNTMMKNGDKFFNEQIEVLPEIYKVLIDEDEDGNIFIPSYINKEGIGMVYAIGKDRDNWVWAAMKYVEVQEEEKEKFKGKQFKPDIKSEKRFAERDFMEALDYTNLLNNL